MRHVYIVERGEQSEGGSVVAVFETASAAKRCALEQKPHFGDWTPVKSDYPECSFLAMSGTDYVTVTRRPVQS